jgi:Pentapeptide repeats (9 copies)
MAMDDLDKPESKEGEDKAPKTKAEDNPWYLLATLYGVPREPDYKVIDLILRGVVPKCELREKNRIAWNRYFAANLDNETRARLIDEKRHPVEELTPLSAEEFAEVEEAFAKRADSSTTQVLPPLNSLINFSDVQFDNSAFFAEYLFARVTFFFGATFSGIGNSFHGATFCGGALFGRAVFSGGAYFSEATFSGGASFLGATFSGGASFDGATFPSEAEFVNATFPERTTFSGATFCGNAVFQGATFSSNVLFDGATFSGRAWFVRAKFHTLTSFVNAEMKNETWFENVIFYSLPPHFFNAKLHQGTVWRGIAWPPKPKDKDKAGEFIDAYACLKLEMDRLKKHEDELDFFALELQSRRMLLGPWRGWPIWLYGVLSDYGRSYALPFLWLLVVAAIGAMLLAFSDALPIEKSFGLSIANTLNVFCFRKDFFDATTIEGLPAP